jgi:isopenicillin N synthase-like dioxygenase
MPFYTDTTEAKLEIPESNYHVGWAVGKEMLRNGKPDTLKGSFFANCSFYVDPKLSCAPSTQEFNAETFPQYLTANRWPDESVLPGFQETFQALCGFIIDKGLLVARACDRYAEGRIEGYEPGYLERVVHTSMTTKARLLHYFPSPKPVCGQVEAMADDDWCATHRDHCCLTGLTSAMFIDEALHSPSPPSVDSSTLDSLPCLPELLSSPDPEAGLYILSRTGKIVHVSIPKDCIAFQTGETLEKITKGRFKAVPHYVRGVRPGVYQGSVARNTLAVFMQPNLGEWIDAEKEIKYGDFARRTVKRYAVG